MPADCSLELDVYQDDRATIAWTVSTDPAHATPYLVSPTHYGEQQIDVAKGAATIGTVTVGVIDPATIAGDQDSGWMTERLVDLYGHRCRLRRYIDAVTGYVVIADGPAGEPRMDDSYAAYTWEIRDTRETERKVRAFDRGGTATVLPAGVLGGYGDLGAGSWLVAPTVPLNATFVVESRPGFPGPHTYFKIVGPPVLTDAITAALQPVPTGESFGGRPLYTYPTIAIWWRDATGPGAWHVIEDHVIPGAVGAEPPSLIFFNPLPTPDELFIYLRKGYPVPTMPDEPSAGASVHVMIVHVGPASSAYPAHIDGITAGAFLQNAYDGDYSGGISTGIRYDAAQLALMADLVRIRLTEPIEDLRDWTEKHIYAPTGWTPALDSEGRISPVTQEPPASGAGLPTIDDTNAEPRPSWGAGKRIVNMLRVTSSRDYIPTDPEVEVAGDLLASVQIEYEFRDEASITKHGEQPVELDGRAFRAVSEDDGAPLDDDLTAETSYQLAHERNVRVKGRYSRGAPSFAVSVMRSTIPTVRAGSFVNVDLPWMPNPSTLRRGLTGMAQVLSVADLDCAWRECFVEMLPPPPSAITGLAATAVSSSEIDLEWSLPIGATGVKLYRSTSSGFTPGGGNLIATLGAVEEYSDTGRAASTTYYYRAIAFNDAGDAAASNEASATTPALPAPPDLVSVGRTQVEDGDMCAGRTWHHEVSWVTTGADDVEYRIDIHVATDLAGATYTPLVSDLTTLSSSFEDDTGESGNISGSTSPTTVYRKYRVRLVRRSDGALIEQMDTTQGTLTYYSDACV